MNRERPSTLSRRGLLAAMASIPLGSTLLSACGDDSPAASPGGSEPQSTEPKSTEPGTVAPTEPPPTLAVKYLHGTGVNDVVLRIEEGFGAFTMAQFAFRSQPTLMVTGDGTVYLPGAVPAIFPGPMLPAVTVGRIDVAAIQTLLETADAAGLLGEIPDYLEGQPPVADVGSTIVTINVNGKEYRHEAMGLGMSDPAGGPVPAARQALSDFVDAVREPSSAGITVTELGGIELVEQFAIGALETDPTNFGDPKPTVEPLPAAISLDLAAIAGSGCVVVPKAAVFDFLQPLNEHSFFTQNAKTYQLLVRAQIPGSPDC